MKSRRVTATAVVVALITFGAVASADDQSPGPRFGHEMVYDEARGETVLFGGFGPDGVPKGDTWTWNGTSWRLASTGGPSPRKWPAAAYDSKRRVIILHGGREGIGRTGPSLDDTWQWDGSAWSEVHVDGPTPRDHHRSVYDRARDRIVLFGGWNGEALENDTWEWNGTGWRKASASGPGPRAPFGLAYDESSDAVILGGGQNLERSFSDMWTWDGSEWTQLDSEFPSPRGFHAMNWSAAAVGVVLFGGRDGDRLLDDLWIWKDRRWHQGQPGGPLRRGIFASAFDRERSELLIHGGGDRVDDGWVLTAQTWAWSAESGWRIAFDESNARADSTQEPEVRYVDTLDEIIVYGAKSLHVLREEVIEAELRVFDTFNALNSTDEFDIHCVEEARTGTRIKTRLCRPNFVTGITDDARHSTWARSGRAWTPHIPDWAGVNVKHRLLEEEMETLMAEHPELLEAIIEYAVAKQALAKEKVSQCRGKGMICDQ